jgi:hypothetical protein
MKKRSFMLALTVGLLGSLASATPSQAGTLLVTTTVNFGTLAPSTSTLMVIDIFYNGVSSISSLNSNLLGGFDIPPIPGPITIAPATVKAMGTDEVVITFSAPVTYVAGSFTFATPMPMHGSPALMSYSTPPTSKTVGIGVTSAPVPEPSSMALLGIGMTSFLAFRRLFKRNSAV